MRHATFPGALFLCFVIAAPDLDAAEEYRPGDNVVVIADAALVSGDGAVVLARRITPAHRLYGWLFARTAGPAFVIGASLQGRDELIGEIEARVRTTPPTQVGV